MDTADAKLLVGLLKVEIEFVRNKLTKATNETDFNNIKSILTNYVRLKIQLESHIE